MFKKLLNNDNAGKDRPSSSTSVASDGDAAVVVNLHADAHEDGGLSCNNDELLRQQQKAIMKWMKSMGQRLFSGNFNALNTPFPVDMFEPRSYLEKLADVWVYPRFLNEAAATTSPLERMRLTVTWFIAGLHHSFEKWRKPFNPILGETWQACLSDGSAIFMEQISHHPPVSAFHIQGPGDNYRFVGLSQPHVSIMLKAYGFKTVAKGYRYIEFADGSRITIDYPAYVMKGVVYSSRPRAEVEGTATFVDEQNCLKAFVRFGSHKAVGGKGLMKRSDAIVGEVYDIRGVSDGNRSAGDRGGVGAGPRGTSPPKTAACSDDEFESASETDWDMRDDSPDERPNTPEMDGLPSAVRDKLDIADDLAPLPSESQRTSDVGQSLRTSDVGQSTSSSSKSGMFSKMFGLSSGTAAPVAEVQSGTVVSTLEGSWLAHIDFDGKRYWALKEDAPDEWMPVQSPIGSDCRFRQDLAYLHSGRPIKEVQAAKEELEQLQRADAKLRGIH